MSNYVGNNTNNEVLKGKLVYYINNTTGDSANSIVQFRNFEETAEKDVMELNLKKYQIFNREEMM